VSIWGQVKDIRLEWGGEGVEALGRDCAVLIIVDVLSFGTTVDLVLGRGGRVLPLRWRDERAAAAAAEAGAILAGQGEWTLRPSSVVTFPTGELLALPSPNGATLCAAAAGTRAHVFAGCLRNASAVAQAAHRLAAGRPIGVIPAGERWGVDLLGGQSFGPLRPCAEDLLGAGAIVAALLDYGLSASTEARLAATAYFGMDIATALAECSSGRELTAAGHSGDIPPAAEVNVSTSAPRLAKGVLQNE
jgi:2-phosphosulfolactate phosphatase